MSPIDTNRDWRRLKTTWRIDLRPYLNLDWRSDWWSLSFGLGEGAMLAEALYINIHLEPLPRVLQRSFWERDG